MAEEYQQDRPFIGQVGERLVLRDSEAGHGFDHGSAPVWFKESTRKTGEAESLAIWSDLSPSRSMQTALSGRQRR